MIVNSSVPICPPSPAWGFKPQTPIRAGVKVVADSADDRLPFEPASRELFGNRPQRQVCRRRATHNHRRAHPCPAASSRSVQSSPNPRASQFVQRISHQPAQWTPYLPVPSPARRAPYTGIFPRLHEPRPLKPSRHGRPSGKSAADPPARVRQRKSSGGRRFCNGRIKLQIQAKRRSTLLWTSTAADNVCVFFFAPRSAPLKPPPARFPSPMRCQ